MRALARRVAQAITAWAQPEPVEYTVRVVYVPSDLHLPTRL